MRTERSGQSYEDSIQELNNLIGELDSFQREHENKMQHKMLSNESMESLSNSHATPNDSHHRMSLHDDVSSPLLSSTLIQTNNHDCNMDDLENLADCYATTASLKKSLSTTEHPLMMRSMNGLSSSHDSNNTSSVVHTIELIPDNYHSADNYVKKNSEIVVLRRKDSQTDLINGIEVDSGNMMPLGNGCANNVERISAFRCSSFTARNDNNLRATESTAEHKTDDCLAHSIDTSDGMGKIVSRPHSHDKMDSDHMTQIRKRPVINPRPASLSGLSISFLIISFFQVDEIRLCSRIPN